MPHVKFFLKGVVVGTDVRVRRNTSETKHGATHVACRNLMRCLQFDEMRCERPGGLQLLILKAHIFCH